MFHFKRKNKESICFTDNAQKHVATTLPKSTSKNALDLDNNCIKYIGEDLFETFSFSNASYRKKNKQTRINEDFQMHLQETDIEKNLVAAGTFYASKTTATASHIKESTETWAETSRYLEDENLLIMLS